MFKVSKSFLAPLALLVTSVGAQATTITSFTVSGGANPLFTVVGTGFLPVPAATSTATPGFSGLDYGSELYVIDYASTAPFANFAAGYDKPGSHDGFGLASLSYTDTLITFTLGTEFASQPLPKIFGINRGDTVSVTVHGVTANVLITPEPSSFGLLIVGGLATMVGYRKRGGVALTR